MTPETHYAILVAINHYPGLSDLHGPENDAEEFRRWLVAPDGGGLLPDHVKLIRSSDYQANPDPYASNPTETAFKIALNAWLKEGGAWREHVGERLYLFFAGHGFSAGSSPDPALFTAQAQMDDMAAYIAGRRYADKIGNAGFFDEVVLLMDCCQDVLRTVPVVEPGWAPPDRRALVKTMRAFGANRGYKAFESEEVPGGPPPRGYFSSTLIDALRQAAPDAQGWVTARAVEDCFGTLWQERHPELADQQPPFDAPKGMRLYQRALAAGAAVPPLAAALSVAARSAPMELPLGAELRILDARDRIIARAGAGDALELPVGRSKVQLRVGNKLLHEFVHVAAAAGGPHVVDLAQQLHMLPDLIGNARLASPVAAPWSSSHHAFHEAPARDLLARASRLESGVHPPAATASLLVFARDSGHRQGRPWTMDPALRHGLRIRRLAEGGGEELALADLVFDELRGFCAVATLLPAADYLLGVLRPTPGGMLWQEMLLHLVPQWRTEVWIDSEPAGAGKDSRQFAVDTAAQFARRWEESATPAGRSFDARAPEVEALRLGLLGRSAARQETALERWFSKASYQRAGPCELLLASALALRAGRPELPAQSGAVDWLRAHWSSNSADLAALAWAGGQGPGAIALSAPMLAASWGLLAQCGRELPRWLQREVGWWRLDAGPWLQTCRPPDEPSLGAAHAMPATEPRDLQQLARSIDRRGRRLSPLQQSLRSAILSAAEDGESEAAPVLKSIGEAFQVSCDSVSEALAGLAPA